MDRTAGSEGERAAADYLARKLAEYGIRFTKYDSRLYLSWPGRAERGGCRSPAASQARRRRSPLATPKAGVSGALVLEPKLTRRVDQTLAFGPEVAGTIPVVRGIADTEALVLAGQQAGALAVLQIDATDKLHEDIVTTIWGTPTPESAAVMPGIPYICITKSDGERLVAAAARGPVTATLTAEVTRGWRVDSEHRGRGARTRRPTSCSSRRTSTRGTAA